MPLSTTHNFETFPVFSVYTLLNSDGGPYRPDVFREKSEYLFNSKLMRELIRKQTYSRTAVQAVFHFRDYLLQSPVAYTKQLSDELRPIIREEKDLIELYKKENASPTIKNAFDLQWEKGVQQGLEQGVKKVVVEMLRKGTSTEFIAEVTH